MQISDLFESSARLVTLWHGGKNLESDYLEVRAHKKGRWEHGPGLYLTTHVDTASRYAKGGGRLYRVTVALGRDIADVSLNLDDAISFVKRNVVGRLQKVMIDDLTRNLERVGWLGAETLVNLCLNHEAIPNSKTDRLRQFLIDNGVDYSRTRYGGRDETVVVVINPRIIKKVEIVRPRDVDPNEYVQTITEAPIANFDYIDRSAETVSFPTAKEPVPRDHSFRDDDRRAMQSPKWKAKVLHAFRNTPEPINVYAVNAKWLTIHDSRYREDGMRRNALDPSEVSYQRRVNTHFLRDMKEWAGSYPAQDFKATFGFLPPDYQTSLNFTMLQNEGDERVPLTPWMLGHRMIHALVTNETLHDGRYWNSFNNAFRHLGAAVNTMLDVADVYIAGAKEHGSFEAAQAEVYAKIGTFASARNKKIIRGGEFVIELVTQYLFKGDFDFKTDWLTFDGKRGYHQSEEYVQELVEEAKQELNKGFEEAVGSLIVF